MYSYIIDDKIIDYKTELDSSLYSYPQLTESQKTFRANNPDADLDEIMNEALNTKTLDDLKLEKLAELNANYNDALTFTHTFSDNEVLTLTLTEEVQKELNKRGISLSVNTDANKTFVFYDNNYQKIVRNASDSSEYLEAVADHLESLREQKTDKTIAINIAQDETALNNVDITFDENYELLTNS